MARVARVAARYLLLPAAALAAAPLQGCFLLAPFWPQQDSKLSPTGDGGGREGRADWPATPPLDLSTPRAAAGTYYQALAAGDATAAKAAAVSDDLTERYIDSAVALSDASKRLYFALVDRFGRSTVRGNPQLMAYVDSFSSRDAIIAIADGDLHVQGNYATLYVRPRGAFRGNGGAPAVFRRENGQWKLAMLATRQMDPLQSREAIYLIDQDLQSAQHLLEVTRAVQAGRYPTVADAWAAGRDSSRPDAGGVASTPAPHDGPPVTLPTIAKPTDGSTGRGSPDGIALANSGRIDAGATGADGSPRPPAPASPIGKPPAGGGMQQTGTADGTGGPGLTAPASSPGSANRAISVDPAPAAEPPTATTRTSQPPAIVDGGGAEMAHPALIELIKARLTDGTDVNAHELRGRTMLHEAAIGGQSDVATFLIGKGADVKAVDDQGWTPLHWAASGGHARLAMLLLNAGAPVDAKDKLDETPLHWAAIFDQQGVASVLLAHSASVAAKDIRGKTPLHVAVEHDARGMAELLIAKGASVKSKDEDGMTPLHAAVVRARASLSDQAIARRDGAGAAPGVAAAHESPETTLAQSKAMIQALVSAGTDVNIRTEQGLTPLHLAAWDETADLADLLLRLGADPESRDNKGRTPLALATQRGQQKMIDLLKSKGATK